MLGMAHMTALMPDIKAYKFFLRRQRKMQDIRNRQVLSCMKSRRSPPVTAGFAKQAAPVQGAFLF